MNVYYNLDLKKKLCTDICIHGKSTIKIAQEFNIPLKTLEKWITAFNKNPHCFDPKPRIINDFKVSDSIVPSDFDSLSNDELKRLLMKKDIEITRLKKGYLLKEGGMGEKAFVTFSKKNTK